MASLKSKNKKKRQSTASEIAEKRLSSMSTPLEQLGRPLPALALAILAITLAYALIGSENALLNLGFVGFGLLVSLTVSYFALERFKADRDDLVPFLVPVLAITTTLFLYHAYAAEQTLYQRDFTTIACFWATLCALVGLRTANLISLSSAVVMGLFFGTLYTHMAPYGMPYLSALDPYWFLKWTDQVVDTGYLPDHDYLTYPYRGGILNHDDFIRENPDAPYRGSGLSFVRSGLFSPLMNAVFALLIKPFGLSVHDASMLYPGLLSAFTVVLMYLLVKELFHDQEPYNRVAGILAAFMLMLSPAYSTRAVAGNAEDDSLGMFFLVAGFYLLAKALRERSLKTALLSGAAFFTLTLTWSGFRYIIMVVGAASTLYSLVAALHKRFAAWHSPYVFLALSPVFFVGVILHARGSLPALYLPAGEVVLFSFLGGVFAPIVFEAIRKALLVKSESFSQDETTNPAERFIYERAAALSLVCLIVGLAAFAYMGPSDVAGRFYDAAFVTRTQSVVGKTIAEQNPLAGDFSGFIDQGHGRFGLALPFGLLMIIPLGWLAVKKKSFGAIAVLLWSVPMMWGVYNKSQFLFVSSASIAALGATIGLFAPVKKADFGSLRIIAFFLVIVVPLLYLPFFGAAQYGTAVGISPMHMGPGWDRSYWEPALQWFASNSDPDEAVLTWWDYGHWLTSIPRRPVLIDNLQADQHQIQDVAQFFVNKTTEEEAFHIVEVYNDAYQRWRNVTVRYVTIDWSMIGKGSALHFIATGVIENHTEGSFKNYAQCSFSPQLSQLNPQMTMGADGNFYAVRKLVYPCSGYVGMVVFEITSDDAGNPNLAGVSVREIARDPRTGQMYPGAEIPWDQWVGVNDASLLGVQHPQHILSCGLSYGSQDRPFACQIPTFSTFVYVPGEFSDFMLTKLYLGQYLDAYKQLGLYNREVTPLDHFELVWDGLGADGNFGTVKIWRILYDEELDRVEPSPENGSSQIVDTGGLFTPQG